MIVRVPAVALLVIAAIAQVSLGETLAVQGIRPGFIFITVYGLSVAGGEGRGLMYGAIGGLMEDCLSSGLMGLMLSGYSVAGYLAGRLGRRVFNIGESANFVGILALSLVQGAYTAVVIGTFMGGYEIFGGLLRYGLPQALYNAAVGAAVLWMVDRETAERHSWGDLLDRIQVRI